jgi:signal transduction histidine kinase
MSGDFIILIIVFNYLRRALRSKEKLPDWDRLLFGGMLLSVGLLVLQVTVRPLQPVTVWIAHLLFFAILYLAFKQREFQALRSIAYALLPLIAIDFAEDVVKLVSRSFYDEWENYFSAASIFAIVWLVAMVIINNRQRKALERERQKAIEKEKEFQLSEKLKAALEVQVAERTAELLGQKQALQKTLDELKSTQSQLIQSEKMASLGELTAGIAHEIQNPLNFVNNFSEVNSELISELVDEVDKGNTSEVKLIAADIKENSEKINHHGKRADAIVKGMLQHSSSGSGKKEPTNINALADEYLRLAYHGLRAKDKSFNATMKTEFDETIGNINIIPQEIGRVILNLITNAFYVVNEKSKQNIAGYEPTVSVSTKKVKDKVEIKVADNGNGIPQKILDKIFQPFFTTKPTGQGTGLGLSLSYDIVKAHGGELKVETKEGEDSTFIIQLPVI